MNFTYTTKQNKLILPNFLQTHTFSASDTLLCGQCFRFFKEEDGSLRGVVRDELIHLLEQDNDLVFFDMTPEVFETIVVPFFDFERNYDTIRNTLARNPALRKCTDFAPGIRVLNQEPFEALISYIISQNNNILRIQKIVRSLCEQFGDKIADGAYAFPTAERLAALSVDDLAEVRAGFRARYILDGARKVAEGTVPLETLSSLPIEEAREILLQIHGVGPKVAECVLLFGLGFSEAFPRDVWINRAEKTLFKKGLPNYILPYAGIAQQFLFHYARMHPDFVK